MDRELIAYVLIGIVALTGLTGWAVTRRRRKIARLRRRGVKTYGH